MAAGGLKSDMNDMLKFLDANIAGTDAVSLRLQRTHAVSKKSEGLAWAQATGMLRLVSGGQTVWHNGGTGGFASYIGFDRSEQVGVVVLSNQETDITAQSAGLLRLVRTHSLASNPQWTIGFM